MVDLPAERHPPGLLGAVRRSPRKKLQAVARALVGKGPRTGGSDRDHEPDSAVSATDFLRDGGNAEAAVEAIEVLFFNWTAVAVFQRCRPQWITGMHAPVYDGISATEISAAAGLLGVEREEYPDLLFCLDVLIQATREARSEAA
ncbi:hypothetical protein D7Y61_15260 [Stenotrophomonas maltophilia]|nr:hypothetical protein [Stenotrophomonas maltophilia]